MRSPGNAPRSHARAHAHEAVERVAPEAVLAARHLLRVFGPRQPVDDPQFGAEPLEGFHVERADDFLSWRGEGGESPEGQHAVTAPQLNGCTNL